MSTATKTESAKKTPKIVNLRLDDPIPLNEPSGDQSKGGTPHRTRTVREEIARLEKHGMHDRARRLKNTTADYQEAAPAQETFDPRDPKGEVAAGKTAPRPPEGEVEVAAVEN